jgi:hypothetical protein
METYAKGAVMLTELIKYIRNDVTEDMGFLNYIKTLHYFYEKSLSLLLLPKKTTLFCDLKYDKNLWNILTTNEYDNDHDLFLALVFPKTMQENTTTPIQPWKNIPMDDGDHYLMKPSKSALYFKILNQTFYVVSPKKLTSSFFDEKINPIQNQINGLPKTNSNTLKEKLENLNLDLQFLKQNYLIQKEKDHLYNVLKECGLHEDR